MANIHDISRNACQLFGKQAQQGYDWWWHSFTGEDAITGDKKAFFIEFFACNPAYAAEHPIFGDKPSYVMVKVGAWGDSDKAQLHRFFGWQQAQIDFGVPFSVKADDCFVTENETRGSVTIKPAEAQKHPEWMSDAGAMSWNLKINKQVAFHVGYGASAPMRKWQLFEMFWHAEGMKTAYDGEVVWNGRKYIVRPQTCYGYADKNWGRDFTSPWVWLSSCNLTSELTAKKLTNSVFDIGGGRPKVGPLILNRQLLSDFWYEGRDFEFNFSKFWTACRTKFECRETDTQIIWHVEQRTWLNRMVTDITCEKKDMLLVRYQSPDGAHRHQRLWNGGTGKGTVAIYRCGPLIDRLRADNVGCEYGEY